MPNFVNREPNFDNILKVLRCEKPDRPTLFEFYTNNYLYEEVIGPFTGTTYLEHVKYLIKGFAALGYDYATVYGAQFNIMPVNDHRKESISINHNASITDRDSFENYPCPIWTASIIRQWKK